MNVRQLGDRAHALIREGKYVQAIAIFDEIVERADLPLEAYCNALWVVQHDNTKLPIDAARSRKYLATCVPFGASNPPIHLNAAGVCAELGEIEEAITNLVLAKRGGVDLTPYFDEPLFAPLRAHARWSEVTGESSVRRPTHLEAAEAAISRGEYAYAVTPLVLAWQRTRSPRVAELLDRVDVACERRVGYRAEWIETGLAEGSLALVDELGMQGRVLRDGKGGYGEKRGIWLVEDCDDPRFATGLLRVMAGGPPLPERKKIEEAWALMWSTLVALGDQRVVATVTSLGAQMLAGDSPMTKRLREGLAISVEELREQRVAPLSDEDSRVCERLEAALATFAVPSFDVRGATVDAPERPRSEHPLEEARAALERGALDEAMALLVEAWQGVRAPRIANLVDALDARMGRAPLIDEWDEDANVDAERLWKLRGTDDPRVATLLCRMFTSAPHIAPREHDNGVEAFWVSVLDALGDLRDRRAIGPMEELAKRAPGLCATVDREAQANMYEQSPLGGFLQYQMGLVIEKLRGTATATLSAEESTACEALERMLEAELQSAAAAEERARERAAMRPSLWGAIAAAPDDDEPRRAFAAFLRQSDDVLDHSHAALLLGDGSETVTELLDDHILGELAPFVRVTRWDRGVPVAVAVEADSEMEGVVGHIAWSTVVELTVHSWSMYERQMCKVFTHPVMASLRSIAGISASGLVTLTRARTLPLVHVGIDLQNQGKHHWSGNHREALDRLPALRSLELILYPHDLKLEIAPLLAWPVIAKLDHLAFAIRLQPYSFLTAWIDVREQLEASPLRELHVCWQGYRARFGRDARGGFGALVIEHSHAKTYRMGDVMRLLWVVPAASLSSFTLVDEGLHPTEREVGELKRALARFPNLANVTLPPVRDVSERVRELATIVTSGERYHVENAAMELRELRAVEASDALARCLVENEDDDARLNAVFAFAAMPDVAPVPALLRAVKRHTERSGCFAGVLLGYLRVREAFDDMVALLAHDEVEVTIEGLMMLGAPEAAAHLGPLIVPESRQQTRYAALDALGVLDAREEAPKVRAYLGGEDLYSRRHAITALGLIGDASDLAAIEAAPRHGEQVPRRALANAMLGGDTKGLVETLHDWEIRPIRDQAVVGVSLERLRERITPSDELRRAVTKLAGSIIDEERARIADATRGSWLHHYVLATFERVLAKYD